MNYLTQLQVPVFWGVYIISWSDLILNPVFSKILCVKIMIPKYSCRLKETLGHFSQNVIKQNAKLTKRKFYLKIWTNILRNIFFPFFEICDNDALSVCGWRFYFFKPPIWYLFNVKSILWLRATCSRHVPSSTE